MANGARILPEDVREAVRFPTERGTGAMRSLRKRKLRKVKDGAQALFQALKRNREAIAIDRREIRAQERIPLLKQLLEQAGMGGSARRDQ